jgi:hypothetical protein
MSFCHKEENYKQKKDFKKKVVEKVIVLKLLKFQYTRRRKFEQAHWNFKNVNDISNIEL